MSTDTYQKSVIEQGRFKNGEWYCTCGNLAKRWTAMTDAHSGQEFLRCGNSPQCRFFLWQKDEAKAKDGSSQRPPSPQTPTRGVDDHSAVLPTPTSRHDTTTRYSRAAPRGISSTDVSPIPFQLSARSQSSGKADLMTQIIDFLHERNVKLDSSDRIVLRGIVSAQVAMHEAELGTVKNTIGELSKQLEAVKPQP